MRNVAYKITRHQLVRYTSQANDEDITSLRRDFFKA